VEDQTQTSDAKPDEAADAAVEQDAERAAATGESEAASQTEPKLSPNDIFRAAIGSLPSLKPVAVAPDGEPTADASGEDDATAAVKPSESKPLGRRAAAARIAELEQQLAARDPATIRQQVLDELAQQATSQADAEQAKQDAARYLRLRDLPDGHPELSEGDNWAWLQEQKELRAKFPAAEKAIRTQYEAQLETETARLTQREAGIWDDIRGQLRRAGQKAGVDFEQYKGQPSFEAMGSYLYDAGVRSRDAEIDALTRERDELRAERDQQLRYSGPRGLAATRTPPTAGRSSPGTSEPSINDLFRQAVYGRRGA